MQKEHTENIHYSLTVAVLQAQRGEEVSLYSFFNLGIRWGWMVRQALATSLGKRPSTHCTGGLIGPTAALNSCKNICPYQDLIPISSSPQQVTIPNKKYKTHMKN